MKPLFNSILVAIVGACMGFGASQWTVVARVSENSTRVQEIKESFKDERGRTDSRIFALADLVKTVIQGQNEQQKTMQEFVSLIRLQNELLQRSIHSKQ